MSTKLVREVHEVIYHRNGISGDGFHLVRFTRREGRLGFPMLAVVFHTPHCVAVLEEDPEHGLSIDIQSKWRGDLFEPELRAAIAQFRKSEMEVTL